MGQRPDGAWESRVKMQSLMGRGARVGRGAGRGLGLAMVLAAGLAPLAGHAVAGGGHADDACSVGCGKACTAKRLWEAGLNPDGSRAEVMDRGPGATWDFGPAFDGGWTPTGGEPSGYEAREAFDATDLLSAKLDLELFPTAASPADNMSGVCEMRVRSLVPGLTQFTFMLRSQFVVTDATVDGTVVSVAAPVGNSYARVVTLPRAYAAGEEFVLRVPYRGRAASRGGGSIEFTSLGGQPAVFSLSQPYYAATWWPIKDGDFGAPGDNADKATFEVWLTAPTAMTSVSNGLLQGVDTLTGSRRRFRWRTQYATPSYLVFIASAVYNQWTRQHPHAGGNMPVDFYIAPSADTAANRTAAERTMPMLTAFRGVFGEYPFINERYGIYQFTFGGGMEHQTISGQNGWGESLTAHELAHQWWGDHVTCRTWRDIWLNEGMATYSEAIWEERKPGSSGLAALSSAMVARKPGNVAGTVYCYDTSNWVRIFDSDLSYRKGAWVYHMLRGVLGDAAFWQVMADWRTQFGGSAGTTADFEAVAEASSGRDLGWFFTQWVYNGGAPAYRSASQTVVINGQRYAKVRLEQTQAGTPFRMPIQLWLNWTGGSVTRVVQHDAASEHYVVPALPTATGTVGVAVDKDNWVLNTTKTTTTYVAGPPSVVEVLPAPGATVPVGGPGSITVRFSEVVSPTASDFQLVGPGGAVPLGVSWNAAGQAAVLSLPTLPAGGYTLTVRDTIVANGLALDGEYPGPIEGLSLPSGNGQPGGGLVVGWTVPGPSCAADFDGSGGIPDIDDIIAYFEAFNLGDVSADFDGSGGIPDIDDILAYFEAFAQGC